MAIDVEIVVELFATSVCLSESAVPSFKLLSFKAMILPPSPYEHIHDSFWQYILEKIFIFFFIPITTTRRMKTKTTWHARERRRCHKG